MRLLAIDTALDACSVAVAADAGRCILASRSEEIGRGHAERLIGLVEAVLAEAGVSLGEIGRIAATAGPGSFTGIRVGLAAARGFGLVLGVPVVGVPTLDAIAEDIPADRARRPLLVALDARRDEVYAARFDAAGHPLGAPEVAAATAIAATLDGPTRLAGSGASLVAAQAKAPVEIVSTAAYPAIAAVARLGARLDPAGHPPLPLYVRAPDAKPQAAPAGLVA